MTETLIAAKDIIWSTIKVLHPTFSLIVSTIALYYGIKYRFYKPKFHLVVNEDSHHPEKSQIVFIGANNTNKDMLIRRSFISKDKLDKDQIDNRLKSKNFDDFCPVKVDTKREFFKISRNSFFNVEVILDEGYPYSTIFEHRQFYLILEFPDATLKYIWIKVKPRYYECLDRICSESKNPACIS